MLLLYSYVILHLFPNFSISTPILTTAFESSVQDIAGAPEEVRAQYDNTVNSVNKLKGLIDLMKDVRHTVLFVCCCFPSHCSLY